MLPLLFVWGLNATLSCAINCLSLCPIVAARWAVRISWSLHSSCVLSSVIDRPGCVGVKVVACCLPRLTPFLSVQMFPVSYMSVVRSNVRRYLIWSGGYRLCALVHICFSCGSEKSGFSAKEPLGCVSEGSNKTITNKSKWSHISFWRFIQILLSASRHMGNVGLLLAAIWFSPTRNTQLHKETIQPEMRQG